MRFPWAVACLLLTSSTTDSIKGFWRLVVWGLPAAVLVIAALSLESVFQRLPALGQILGDASYSIYLSHTFVISALAKTWTIAIGPPQANQATFVIIAFVMCATFGIVSYLLIEQPIARWSRRRPSTPAPYAAHR